jgi:hypothetical protein
MVGLSAIEISKGYGGHLDDVTRAFSERGDLAHLALFLWASGASALLVWALRELAASNRRFNDFVNEIARLNRFFNDRD